MVHYEVGDQRKEIAMSKGYWVKGYPYSGPDKRSHKVDPVIHRFDTLKEAEFFKNQIAHGEILPWGEAEEDYNAGL